MGCLMGRAWTNHSLTESVVRVSISAGLSGRIGTICTVEDGVRHPFRLADGKFFRVNKNKIFEVLKRK